jgi:chromosome segregation ATPase
MQHLKGLLYGIIAALVCATGLSLGYLSHERQQARELEATNQSLSTSLTEVQTELQSVTDRLNGLSEPRSATPSVKEPPKPKVHVVVAKRAPASKTKDDPRWEQIQNQLSDQQQQLASTREELEGKVDSTRDELSGSIARTHDELAALEKRGERTYYEFKLDKSKKFQRVGPLSVELRKANVKRKSYDVTMLVDDNQLQKKSINLFEPVWINLADRPEPLQLVVNKIDKDQIRGYLSEPKYKQSELNVSAKLEQ